MLSNLTGSYDVYYYYYFVIAYSLLSFSCCLAPNLCTDISSLIYRLPTGITAEVTTHALANNALAILVVVDSVITNVVPLMTTAQVVIADTEVGALVAVVYAHQKCHMVMHATAMGAMEAIKMQAAVPGANVLVATVERKCRLVIVAPQITTVLVVIVVDGSLLDAEEDANNRCLRR